RVVARSRSIRVAVGGGGAFVADLALATRAGQGGEEDGEGEDERRAGWSREPEHGGACLYREGSRHASRPTGALSGSRRVALQGHGSCTGGRGPITLDVDRRRRSSGCPL